MMDLMQCRTNLYQAQLELDYLEVQAEKIDKINRSDRTAIGDVIKMLSNMPKISDRNNKAPK